MNIRFRQIIYFFFLLEKPDTPILALVEYALVLNVHISASSIFLKQFQDKKIKTNEDITINKTLKIF